MHPFPFFKIRRKTLQDINKIPLEWETYVKQKSFKYMFHLPQFERTLFFFFSELEDNFNRLPNNYSFVLKSQIVAKLMKFSVRYCLFFWKQGNNKA